MSAPYNTITRLLRVQITQWPQRNKSVPPGGYNTFMCVCVSVANWFKSMDKTSLGRYSYWGPLKPILFIVSASARNTSPSHCVGLLKSSGAVAVLKIPPDNAHERMSKVCQWLTYSAWMLNDRNACISHIMLR